MLRETEKLLVTSNFSFSRNVFYPILPLYFILYALCFNLDQSKILSSGNGLMRQTKWLSQSEVALLSKSEIERMKLTLSKTSLLKTLWEKEKLLVTSNFSFINSVFTRLRSFQQSSSNLKLSSANSFSLEESKICQERVKNGW